MVLVLFSVPFVDGKARPIPNPRGGKPFTPQKTRDQMDAIAEAYKAASIEQLGYVYKAPKGVPLGLSVIVQSPLPSSRPKRIKAEPNTYKPDGDNVLKLVADALNKVAYHDDNQITHWQCDKSIRERDQEEKIYIMIYSEDPT